MNIGTKSLLFGVHQFALHPLMVLRAWHHLYGWPNWWEFIAIVVHDWGYWGSPEMDGEYGELHPERSGWIALGLVPHGKIYREILYHSRHYARRYNQRPSRLCWADKLAPGYYGRRLYLFLGHLTGEIAGYRQDTADAGLFPLEASDEAWYDWLMPWFEDQVARGLRGEPTTYVNRQWVKP